jgi:hypothetical protein
MHMRSKSLCVQGNGSEVFITIDDHLDVDDEGMVFVVNSPYLSGEVSQFWTIYDDVDCVIEGTGI